MNWLEPIGARIVPANFGPLRDFQAHARVEGSCGDTMEFWVRLDGFTVVATSFTTDGCETSVASGSVAAYLSQGKSLGQVWALRPIEVLHALGLADDESAAEVHHCAELALDTLTKALKEYETALRRKMEPAAEACEASCGSDCGSCTQEACDGCAQHVPRSSTRRILVMSGKGGVGKSTVAVNLAMGFAAEGLATGLLDVDVHGPSVPKLLGLEQATPEGDEQGLHPVELGSLKVMSMGFLLAPDQAAIMRGPRKAGVVEQLVNGVVWGPLDVMVVDCPPGTSDEHLSVHQALGHVEGAVIVTTPQEVATLDARKAITFCNAAGIPVLGILENMSGFTCPDCGSTTPVFQSGGGARLAQELDLPFLGTLPLDPRVGEGGDAGRPRLFAGQHGEAAKAFQPILRNLLQGTETRV